MATVIQVRSGITKERKETKGTKPPGAATPGRQETGDRMGNEARSAFLNRGKYGLEHLEWQRGRLFHWTYPPGPLPDAGRGSRLLV